MKKILNIGKKVSKSNQKIFYKPSKKIVIYVFVVGILILAIGIYFLSKGLLNKRQSDQKRVTHYIEELGKSFYEDYYYSQLNDMKNNQLIENIPAFLKNFESQGIPVSLNQLIELHFKTKEEIDKVLKNYHCSFEETGFQIYPKSPYQKSSYNLEFHIACENLQKEE